MSTVLLTIVFFASAANAEFKTELQMTDASSCAALAQRWLSYREGMLRVLDARCGEPVMAGATQVSGPVH